ncbi:MAG: translation elongation factor 4 [Limnochordia bacterium]|nr:translation elongation factor 4 [Limnochordia bacterium]MDD2630089.1 translation elongation factor 4 [Limnochordia bacterium]
MQERIRNFCIIAHIDHGKSTLADRLIEQTNTLSQRQMTDQVLDRLDLEKERGITIKLQAVRLDYPAADGQTYILNLIDTPGHVDFSYEVSRSLAACEGALLIIDATQGIEAQTLANLYLALEHDLEIIPVINKIDLPSADPEWVLNELEESIGISKDEALLVSAKTGEGIEGVLEAIVHRIPPPKGAEDAPLRALIFDSHFDSYRGVVAYIRVMEGSVSVKDEIKLMSNHREFLVDELGVFRPDMHSVKRLGPGEVGCLLASMKDVKDSRVGDTITHVKNPAQVPLPGYRAARSMVYCGLYPVDNEDFTSLRDALEKLQLNDAALVFEPETSVALGFGFRCGFLGLLHLEIVQERLEREFDMNLITTAPSVVYRVETSEGKTMEIHNPADFPPQNEIENIKEPFVKAKIVVPDQFIGSVMELCQDRRGEYQGMEYLGPGRAMLQYDLPLSEILMDFFDRLKSGTRGYGTLDYEFDGYRDTDAVKLDILLNGKSVDALSCIVHRSKAAARGRALADKLKDVIPRQMFTVPIQAAVGNKVLARTNIRALRKDVTAKCYGGDVSRKRKLLEKQKEGKKRMKQIGNIEIPQEAFMAILSIEDD